MRTRTSLLSELYRAPAFSPKGMMLRAAIIALGFAACHLLGWREHTTFISGSQVGGEVNRSISMLLGILYMAAYFSVVLLTPILFLTAAIVHFWDRAFSKPEHNDH